MATQQQQQQQLTIPTSTAETTQEEEQGIILDSLPYIDQIHPDYEAYALTLIEEEMMQHPPPSSSSSSSSPSSTPHHLRIPDFQYSQNNVKIMQEEYKQLAARNGQKKSEQDHAPNFLSRYHHDKLLPAAAAAVAQDDNENHHDSSLIESIRSAKIILQHEKIRQINLELYAECTSSSMMWKHHVNMMDKYYAQASKKILEEQLMVVDQLNAERKQMQEEAMKNYLGKLEYRWGELIRKKQHLVKGVKMLEDEMMGWDGMNSE